MSAFRDDETTRLSQRVRDLENTNQKLRTLLDDGEEILKKYQAAELATPSWWQKQKPYGLFIAMWCCVTGAYACLHPDMDLQSAYGSALACVAVILGVKVLGHLP